MCGITGIITRHPTNGGDRSLVQAMNASLVHRGPNGAGEFNANHVSLAMRRLSIIDLNSGWQPLYNEDRSLALVCNGEIYNFVELRKSLEARGHRFATGSDCETILHLYEEHGDGCVNYLRGMYAFALWDSRKRRVLIGRDRMGEKPVYIAEFADRIVFASELKALIKARVVPFELDRDAVNLYFHYGYVPEPRTAVQGVRKLPAAHTLSIEVDPWWITQTCYWRMLDAPPIETDPVTTIRAELDRISEITVRSDVPVGVALSGGLDSSVIATLAAKKYPGVMQAISIGYPGRPRQDERADAKALADHLKLPFHEIELTNEEMIASLPTIMYERDDPIGDLSGSSYYFVLKKARELNVPVMLSGHGGDELFWGYGWVRQAALASERKQRLLANGSVGVKDYLRWQRPPYSYTAGMRWLGSLGGLRTGLRQYRRDRTSARDQLVFYDLEPAFNNTDRDLNAVTTSSFQDEVDHQSPFSLFTLPQPWPPVDLAITRLICDTYMIENGLAQGDRLSMASSVELRLPLVDYRLVETVIGLRKVHRDLEAGPKRWLREAVRGIVPDFVLSRPKRGFTPPWRPWARALSKSYGSDLLDGFLVQHEILTGSGAAAISRRVSPPPLGMPSFLADRALLLELYCRRMSESLQPVAH